ncbi:MAG: NADH-quinone oxidoreductase subunit J [Polyangiaceae bacterium]|nr:NADH-quinone oxidoreductase subunit J [Polyangiaceae bacterium]
MKLDNLETIFFAICTLLVLIGGVYTVAAKNPIRGAMGLLGAILGIAGMYLLLAAELLAAIQVVVYAGAVVVLFLFVIMLIGPSSTGTTDARGALGRYFGAACFALVSVGALYVVMRFGGQTLSKMPEPPAGMGTIEVVGREIFSEQVVAFQISGVLLLIAVVGAMAVARGKHGGEMLLPPITGTVDPTRKSVSADLAGHASVPEPQLTKSEVKS